MTMILEFSNTLLVSQYNTQQVFENIHTREI